MAHDARQEALRRKLDVALREKNRFFADRIAQTELARAHQARVAAEFMADPLIEVLQVLMNPAHPRTDICDLHARANLFGLGPGCYPKAKAPRPPFHPFCWCVLRSRPHISARHAKEVRGGEADFLRGLPPGEAAAVMGSKARAQSVLDGASVRSVVDAAKDPAYRTVLLGEPAAVTHALVENAGVRQFKQPPQTFGPYDPGAPRVKPDTSTPARAAAVKIEDEIRRDSKETGAFFAADGRELLRRQGEPDMVTFLESELSQLRGATFTHNHPGGGGPSVADVALASEFGFAEARAVTSEFRHSLSGLPALPAAQWQREYDATEGVVASALRESVRTGALHPADFGVETRHRAWASLARSLGFVYTREKS